MLEESRPIFRCLGEDDLEWFERTRRGSAEHSCMPRVGVIWRAERNDELGVLCADDGSCPAVDPASDLGAGRVGSLEGRPVESTEEGFGDVVPVFDLGRRCWHFDLRSSHSHDLVGHVTHNCSGEREGFLTLLAHHRCARNR